MSASTSIVALITISGSAIKYAGTHLNKGHYEMCPHQWLQDRDLSNLFKKQSISRCCGDCTDWLGESEPQWKAHSIHPPLLSHSSSPTLCSGLLIKKRGEGGAFPVMHPLKKQPKMSSALMRASYKAAVLTFHSKHHDYKLLTREQNYFF